MSVQPADRDFRWLWAGQSASLLGDQFMTVALPLFAVTVVGVSAAHAALLPFALYAPFLLIGLPAGAIVDRLRRRPTMVVCDLVQAGCFLLIAALALAGTLRFGVLLGLVAACGCATVFFQVAYTSYLPTLYASPADLHRGNSRLALSESLSRSLGPIAAGPVIALLGPIAAVAGNAGSFLVSAATLGGIRTREPAPAAPVRRRGWLVRDVREGLRYVFGHPLLEPVIMCGCVYVLFLSMVETSLVLYARDEFGLGIGGIGLVIGAAALGFPLGNLLSGRLSARHGLPRTLAIGATVSVTGLVAMPIAGSLGSVAGLVAGSVVHGIGEGSFGPASVTLRQTVTPSGLLGRVNSVQRVLLWGAIPLGSLLAAGSIAAFGLSGAIWIGGLGTTLCLVPLLRRGILAALRRTGGAAANRAQPLVPDQAAGQPDGGPVGAEQPL